MANVTIFTLTNCKFCIKAVDLAQERGDNFTLVPLRTFPREDPTAPLTAPQILIEDEHIGGYAEYKAWHAHQTALEGGH